MLLDRYDFHDLYAVLVAFRSNPKAEYNIEITKAIISVLEKQQDINLVEFNIFRNALKSIEKIDKERFYWVYINNAYTYGHRVEKNEFYYDILLNAFRKLLQSFEQQDFDRVYDLADAFHNIPIFIADEGKNFKKFIKIQLCSYNKKYKANLLKELTEKLKKIRFFVQFFFGHEWQTKIRSHRFLKSNSFKNIYSSDEIIQYK